MIARKIARPQTKSIESSPSAPLRRSKWVGPHGHHPFEPARSSQPTIGNQAMLRLLARREPAPTAKPAAGPLQRAAGLEFAATQEEARGFAGRRSQARPGAVNGLSTLRPAGTDDLTQTDLTVPRAGGDAGTPTPTDSGAPKDAGTPDAGPPASCCDLAFSKGLAGSDYGGVICCKNVKNTCVWPSNMSAALTNAKARSISIDCARVHEDTHHDDIDCTGADVERPSFKAGKNARAEECIAYKAEVACFDAHVADCGEDADCKTQMRDRRTTKQGQANANCA